MTDPVHVASWRRTDDLEGYSMARVQRSAEGWVCHATEVVAVGSEPWSCTFSVRLDEQWAMREADVTVVARQGTKQLSLSADEVRRWSINGLRTPDLDGCLDVDIASTPLTNTFPIRRHAGLPVGQAATVAVAWVDVPSLHWSRVDQTYQRLDHLSWQYSDQQYGAFHLRVDDVGLVMEYEGLARRMS